ncbi:hypothetical protein CSKR_100608 [Clonorchis sinensis]|uniref:Uncharacterized protein n=1 Tax=Clonorchis sinensis TaxID=79923 RepID=A0A3R7C7B4_CLOSI|nr:hypothetical protein CSKR_100608 [Clonorchis sinensis]
MPNHRLPKRVLFSMPNSEWRKQRGGQPLTWQKGMKEITKRLGAVGATRLPGWGPRDPQCAWLETLQDMAANRCQWRSCCQFLSRFPEWVFGGCIYQIAQDSEEFGDKGMILKCKTKQNTLICKQIWLCERLTWNPAESLVCDVSRQLNVLHQDASCSRCYDIRNMAIHVYSRANHSAQPRYVTGWSFEESGLSFTSLKCERIHLLRSKNSDASSVFRWNNGNTLTSHVRYCTFSGMFLIKQISGSKRYDKRKQSISTYTLVCISIWFSRETQLNLSFVILFNWMCHTKTTWCFIWCNIRDIIVHFHRGNYSHIYWKLFEFRGIWVKVEHKDDHYSGTAPTC